MENQGIPFFEISAATTQGTRELVEEVGKRLDTLPPITEYEPEPISVEELEAKKSAKQFEITVENGVYYIDAPFLEPVLSTVNMEDYESLQYFQRVLRFSGIIDKLEEMGIKEGDTVDIFGLQFDFVK